MKRSTCPYLGLKEDPFTALNFPSVGNFCHHAQPVSAVRGTYQEKYCLTPEHTSCLVFQAAALAPLPAALALPTPTSLKDKKMLAMVGVPAFIAGVAVLGMAWNAIAARASDSSILVSGANGGVPIGWSIITHTPFAQLPTPQFALAEPTPVNCPMPGDWVAYQVNPTDSLFRLSVVYGVSVEEMQQVNCMGDKTAILPGQIIYVPALATPTPTPTPTAPFFPANLPDQSNHSSGVSQSPPTSPPVIQPAVIPPVVAQGQDKKQKVQPPTNNQGPDKQNKDAKGGGGKNGKGKGKKK